MKRFLTITGFLVILPSLLFAEQGNKRWGVGVNYPGLSVKCGLNAKQTIELKAQFAKDIFVMGPRYYHNFRILARKVRSTSSLEEKLTT